ncbi:hypothetical protein [Microbacterium sp.]|uniref:hypothetical protein n=1 Tax=Microbacterium sp. TaxID=51671 RepID=UPI003A881106
MATEERIVVRPNRIVGAGITLVGVILVAIMFAAVAGGSTVQSVTGLFIGGLATVVIGALMLMTPLLTVSASRVIRPSAGGLKNDITPIDGFGSLRMQDNVLVDTTTGKSLYSFTSFAAKPDVDKLRRRLDGAAR